jgi:acyl-coenzyme A thioesterase PaaI-like protein
MSQESDISRAARQVRQNAAMNDEQIREHVLGGIARNREPGFHFAGNFLDVSYDHVAADDARVSLEPWPHCVDADGQTNIGAVAMIADIALATSVRAAIGSDSARLATVSMHLQFTGRAATGRLEAHGACETFIRDAAARQGLSRVSLSSGGELLAIGTGAFMALPPPPGVTMHPVVTRRAAGRARLADEELDHRERQIVRHADDVLAARQPFIGAFWGYAPHKTATGAECVMANGGHVANRVGHVQGGLLVGLAASTAVAALPATWILSGISACFVSPGEGKELRAVSTVAHHGRETAVVRTEVTGPGGRRVLEATSTHARRKS